MYLRLRLLPYMNQPLAHIADWRMGGGKATRSKFEQFRFLRMIGVNSALRKSLIIRAVLSEGAEYVQGNIAGFRLQPCAVDVHFAGPLQLYGLLDSRQAALEMRLLVR